jgi:hypothetical protein
MLKLATMLLTLAPLKGARTEVLAALVIGGSIVLLAIGVWQKTLTVEQGAGLLLGVLTGGGLLTAKNTER